MNKLIDTAIQASLDGGREILKVYSSEIAVEMKDDRSPLTLADKNAHLAIMEHLEKTGLPVLSEEGKEIAYEERTQWERFWMVDPLDGTKEFIKRNGEFTVNIALIEKGVPIAGVIYVPVRKELYVGMKNKGSYKVDNVEAHDNLTLSDCMSKGDSLPKAQNDRPFMVVGSRSHMSPETEEYINELKKKHGEVEIVSMGSSLKICLVAEGVADAYPRYAPTMEWDTAAGHGIALGAGCEVLDHSTGEAMQYNKENLLNNWFLVSRN
ncbi:MAG: 3'(2'),5'-bisphosphate nucleotidase CysQ [Flavobacteriales bacterium]|nr:3'(2'),5'-bisphosphate nucleotidase CysQ [Flavobacteriales bacterium]NNK81254.1 3'(2'),5'-bisphosphate nucleotidase CysQ [Flavobacteriales bacterium]